MFMLHIYKIQVFMDMFSSHCIYIVVCVVRQNNAQFSDKKNGSPYISKQAKKSSFHFHLILQYFIVCRVDAFIIFILFIYRCHNTPINSRAIHLYINKYVVVVVVVGIRVCIIFNMLYTNNTQNKVLNCLPL